MDLIGSGFVVLAIVTLLSLVIGFLGESSRRGNPELQEPTRRSLAANGAIFCLVGAGWAFNAWTSFERDPGAWFWIAGSAGVAALSLLAGARFIREAARAPN